MNAVERGVGKMGVSLLSERRGHGWAPRQPHKGAARVIALSLLLVACQAASTDPTATTNPGATLSTDTGIGISVIVPDEALDHPLVVEPDSTRGPGLAGSHDLGVAFSLTAAGTQPRVPLEVRAHADTLDASDSELVYLARWDEAEDIWIPLPTRFDAATGQYVATVDHLSSFAFWEWGIWEDVGAGITWTADQVAGAFDVFVGGVQAAGSAIGGIVNGVYDASIDWLGLAGVDAPTCQNPPLDVTIELSDSGENGVMRACIDQTADGQTTIRIANNRPYGLVLTLPQGATADIVSWPEIGVSGEAAMHAFYSAMPFLNEAYVPPSAEIAVTISTPTEKSLVLEATSTPAYVGVDMAVAWLLVFYGQASDLTDAVEAVGCLGQGGGSLIELSDSGSTNPLGFLEGVKTCAEAAVDLDLGEGIFGDLFDVAKATLKAIPALGSSVIDTDFSRFEVHETVTLIPAITPPASQGGDAPVYDELLTAQIPSMCGHEPTRLVDGRDVEVRESEGFFELQPMYATVESSDGPIAAVVASCSAGGVGWPHVVMFFTAGPTYYGHTFLDEYDWASLGLNGPGRNAIESIEGAGDRLVVATGMYVGDEGGCCWTGSAAVSVAPLPGGARIVEVIDYTTGGEQEPAAPTVGAIGLCGTSTVRAWIETTQFDVAICGEPGQTSYVGIKRGAHEGITLGACAVDDYLWVAENNGYRYEVDMFVDGIPSLRVYDPNGTEIVNEPARLIDGALRYEYGLGPSGVYC